MCISNGSLWFSYYDLLDIVFVICDNNCPSLYSLQGTLQHFRLDVQDSGDGLRWWSVGEHFVPDKRWSSLSRSQAAPSWLKSITVASLGRFGPWRSAVTRWIVLQGPEICPDLWYCTICMRRIVLPIFSLILKMMTRVCAMYVHVYCNCPRICEILPCTHSDNLWAAFSFQFAGKTYNFVQRDMQASAEFWPSLTCCFSDISRSKRNATKWSHFVITILLIYHEVYETVRSLRQRRGDRLGAVQRKLPPVQCLGHEGRQLSYDFMSEHVGTENIGYGGVLVLFPTI